MDRLELFRNLMVMAASDGKFTEDEIRFLGQRANKWGITDAEFSAALRSAVDPSAHLTIPEDGEQRRAMLCEMIRMMASDGELAEIEKELFAVAAAEMDIPSEELDQLLDELTGKGK
jgi:uncharacterized tellurite resistance protein B-like protein